MKGQAYYKITILRRREFSLSFPEKVRRKTLISIVSNHMDNQMGKMPIAKYRSQEKQMVWIWG